MLLHSVRNALDGDAKNSASPERLSEPGPGRSTIESSAGLPVAGVQKLLTRTEGCDKPGSASCGCVRPPPDTQMENRTHERGR